MKHLVLALVLITSVSCARFRFRGSSYGYLSEKPYCEQVTGLDTLGGESYSSLKQCQNSLDYREASDRYKAQLKEVAKEKEKEEEEKRNFPIRLEKYLKKHPDQRRFKKSVLAREVNIGMTEEMVYMAWGEPNRVDSSSGRYGEHKQLVYSHRYLYIENGILESWQSLDD